MVSKQFPQQRRSTRLRRRAYLAMQGPTKESFFFGWFRKRRNPSLTGRFESPDNVERTQRTPLHPAVRIILILLVVVFGFAAMIPVIALIKLFFTPG